MQETQDHALDCLVVGYNEIPFERYESFVRSYGEGSPAYRDLQFSCVEVDGRKRTYLELLNHALEQAGMAPEPPFVSGEIPNLAACYLTNFLRQRDLRADYVNLFQEEKERFVELLRRGVGCVAVTTTFYVVNLPVHGIVELVREHAPDTPVVVGGPLVSNHFRNFEGEDLEEALRDMGADLFVVESQGEAALAELVERLRDGDDPTGAPNLAYFDDGELTVNPRKPENNSLDDNAIDWSSFSRPLGPTVQTRTARSCAFCCAFCNYPTRAGKLTLAGLDTLEREFDSMAERGEVENVVFIDDTFNVPLPRFKDICRLLIDKDYGFEWYSYFRCSNSDEEAIELMAESGCKGVFLGIESGSPRILKGMNKRATVEQYREGISELSRRGILTFGSFITGFPGETAETVQETIDFIRGSDLEYYRMQLWYNEPGTPIHQQADEYGIRGEGFSWSHDTMESLEAMDHVDRAFLTIKEVEWLPQWSFDFWVVPYLSGRGVSRQRFDEFMTLANRMLVTDLATLPADEARARKRSLLAEIGHTFDDWAEAA